MQAIILSPICPHVAEYVWTLIGAPGTILKTKWPVVNQPDLVLIKAGSYLNQTVHDLRLRLRAYMTASAAKGAKKGPVVPVEKPTHATIWIAKTYPPWQSTIMTLLKEKFEVSSTSLHVLL